MYIMALLHYSSTLSLKLTFRKTINNDSNPIWLTLHLTIQLQSSIPSHQHITSRLEFHIHTLYGSGLCTECTIGISYCNPVPFTWWPPSIMFDYRLKRFKLSGSYCKQKTQGTSFALWTWLDLTKSYECAAKPCELQASLQFALVCHQKAK